MACAAQHLGGLAGAWQAWVPCHAPVPASLNTDADRIWAGTPGGDAMSKGLSAEMNCCVQEKEAAGPTGLGGRRWDTTRRWPAEALVVYSLSNNTGSELKKEERASIRKRREGTF